LKNQDGNDFGSNDLRGKVYLANFVFSRCPSVCPKMLQDTAKIQERLKDVENIAILSFTVDPDYDTPEILAKVATQYGANRAVWNFLTHGDKMVLVDQVGQVRGYYGYEKEKIEQLIIDATYLAQNPGATP
jgi:protein SCO1